MSISKDSKISQDWKGTKHVCTLPEEEPLLIMYISTGCCVTLRRYIRKKTLVNPKNKVAKKLYLSVVAFKKEMENHMKRHYSMIHPYSKFKVLWETCMVVIVLISLFYYPSLVYVGYDIHAINALLSSIFFMDIIVNFNTGYFSSNANKVILDRRRVSMHYLKTWFFMDFICLMNVNNIFVSQTVSTLLNCINILRISMIVRYLEGFTECTQITFYRFHFTRLLVVTLIILWWASSFLYLLLTVYQEPWLKDTTKYGKAMSCIYRVSYLIFLVGFGEGYSTHDIILIFEILCWIAGTILKIFSFAEVLQIVIKYGSGRNMYHQRMQRLKLMMHRKRLPPLTRSRILHYFDFRFQKNYFKEDEILSSFSQQLKEEVLVHNCKKLIENADIFKNLPEKIVEKISRRMRPVIYLRNDIVVQAGDEGGSMFFIHDGAVAVHSEDGREICHVSDGECFGERAMIEKDAPRLATVVAVDACELYVLSSIDFETALGPHTYLFFDTKENISRKYQRYSFENNKKLYTM